MLTRNGNVGVTYEWEALTRAAVDYHVITELVGPDGQTWSDEQLSLGGRGVGLDEWTPGRWMFQSSTFDVSATAPAGEYVLRVGIYDSRAKVDLPITAGDDAWGRSRSRSAGMRWPGSRCSSRACTSSLLLKAPPPGSCRRCTAPVGCRSSAVRLARPVAVRPADGQQPQRVRDGLIVRALLRAVHDLPDLDGIEAGLDQRPELVG